MLKIIEKAQAKKIVGGKSSVLSAASSIIPAKVTKDVTK